MTEAHWTLGVLIGLPILIIIVLALTIGAILMLRVDDGGIMAVPMIIIAVVIVGFALSPVGYYPYKAEYHQWRPVTGPVERVDKRLIANGDQGMSERYVMVIKGQPYGVDDTRASLVKPGDTVTLSCKREWEYASVPGYVCRWNQ